MAASTKGPVILLDLDGVVADFIGKLLKTYNALYGTSFTHASVSDFMFEKCFDKETASKMYALFNEPGFFADLQKLPGADEAVTGLLEIGHVEICTTPPKIKAGEPAAAGTTKALNSYAVLDKLVWINEHYPQLSRHVTLTNKKHLVHGVSLVDDGIHNIRPWCGAHPAGLGYVVDQPWNRHEELPTNAIRGALIDAPQRIGEWLAKRGNSVGAV